MDRFRPMAESDLSLIRDWRNNPDVRRFMYTQHEISETEHLRWWANQQGQANRVNLVFCADERPLGVVSFTWMDSINGRADWAFYAASDAPKGTGRRMEFAALDHAFATLAIRKLSCEVLTCNRRVILLHKSFGFRIEGLFRQQVKIGAVYDDVLRLALFADGWQKLRDTKQAEMSQQ